MKPIRNIVFDFGGVIVDINRSNAVKRFIEIGVENADALLGEYHQKGIFLEVEDGSIDAEEFRLKLSEIAQKNLTYEEVESGWLGFIADVPQYKLDYLAKLKKRCKVYILSNTNPYVMNWACSKQLSAAGRPLNDYVNKIYTSYEARSIKPNDGIFKFMIKDAAIDPSETLFIDDGAANIAAGKELGFITLKTMSGEDWREKLEKLL